MCTVQRWKQEHDNEEGLLGCSPSGSEEKERESTASVHKQVGRKRKTRWKLNRKVWMATQQEIRRQETLSGAASQASRLQQRDFVHWLLLTWSISESAQWMGRKQDECGTVRLPQERWAVAGCARALDCNGDRLHIAQGGVILLKAQRHSNITSFSLWLYCVSETETGCGSFWTKMSALTFSLSIFLFSPFLFSNLFVYFPLTNNPESLVSLGAVRGDLHCHC